MVENSTNFTGRLAFQYRLVSAKSPSLKLAILGGFEALPKAPSANSASELTVPTIRLNF